ncbi:hypothetical protein ENUP19_0257G0040 [Entamoeba nuttalli]|uniref:Uncharacterized protein n=1 Tax=Entamoeba nuttalli TaxID=412467 RepID=A0ABQ0DRY1_9EUKA
MIGLLICFSVVNAFKTDVYYSISSEEPVEWNKRGTIECNNYQCTFENEQNLEFTKNNELWYYIKVDNTFTSVPINSVSSQMTDSIQLSLSGDSVENIYYSVNGRSSTLKTSASLLRSSEFPKTRPEKRPPPEEEKGFFAKYWVWILIGVVALYFFSG